MTFERLRFKKKVKRIANLRLRGYYKEPAEYDLVLSNRNDEMVNTDTLYDLIKADLIEKV